MAHHLNCVFLLPKHSVVAGASVSVQYLAADTGLPVGEPQPIATQADLAALRNELLTAVATKANTTSVYTTAQVSALSDTSYTCSCGGVGEGCSATALSRWTVRSSVS